MNTALIKTLQDQSGLNKDVCLNYNALDAYTLLLIEACVTAVKTCDYSKVIFTSFDESQCQAFQQRATTAINNLVL